MAVVSPLGCYIYDTSNFGDRLYQIANYVHEATKYDELLRDQDLKSDKDLRGLIKAEDCYGDVGQLPSSGHDLTTVSAHKHTLDRVPIDLKSDGRASLELHPADSIHSSQKGVSFDAHDLPLSEPCSPLESEHGRGGQDASLAPWAACPPKLPQLAELPLLTSIRQVLSSDPSYAEDVICAVNQLPHDERSQSLKSEPEPEPADDPGSPKQSAGPCKKRPRASGNDSNGGGRAGRGTGKGRGGQGAGDRDDRESQDGSGRGDRPRSTRDVNMEKQRCWVCPYSVAYPHLRHNGMSQHCWPGNMDKLYLWRDHLKTHHSPIDLNANPLTQGDVAQLHMNSEQFDRVYNKIEKGSRKRPRDQNEWYCHCKNLFLEVWRIIFPQNQFPHLDEPSSPFLLNSDEITDLKHHAIRLLKSQRHVSANRAVESGAIASSEDFRPSDAELDEMMSKAISAALLSSPVAFDATHRLAHASSQTLQTTSTDDTDAVGSHPETALQDVPPGTHAYTPTAAPRTSGPAPIDLDAAQTTSLVSSIFPVTLFPVGTQVTMNFFTTNWNLRANQMGQLQVSLPRSFYPANYNQVPFMLPTMDTPNSPANPTPPAMDLDPGINQHPSIGQPGSQDASMQEVQGGSFGAEESAVVNNLTGQ